MPDDPVKRPSTTMAGLRRRVAADTAYLLPALPLAVGALLVATTMVLVGASLAVVWVGLPVLALGLRAAAGFAGVERLRLKKLDGTPIPRAAYREPPAGVGGLRRTLWPLRQPQYWLDALWTVIGFITATIAWCLAVGWYSMVAALTYVLWGWFLPSQNDSLSALLGFGSSRLANIIVHTAVGALALVTLPAMLRAAAWLHSGPAKLLLNGRALLRQEIDTERATRLAHQDAEATALRRLERDIHDGPQQRLVRLSMDLGRAKKQLAEDPNRATATIDSALQQARDTVDELRSLTRGIAPPLLVDRGLRVALDEAINRAPVPVKLDFQVDSTLPPAVETAIYFTVSEALTNVAKHSLAHHAEVSVVESAGLVEVSIRDDGMGGAHEAKGSGLRGLRSRIEGVGGSFDVASPAGGPTMVTASLPLLRTRLP